MKFPTSMTNLRFFDPSVECPQCMFDHQKTWILPDKDIATGALTFSGVCDESVMCLGFVGWSFSGFKSIDIWVNQIWYSINPKIPIFQGQAFREVVWHDCNSPISSGGGGMTCSSTVSRNHLELQITLGGLTSIDSIKHHLHLEKHSQKGWES